MSEKSHADCVHKRRHRLREEVGVEGESGAGHDEEESGTGHVEDNSLVT
jgi:hypothetical protein